MLDLLGLKKKYRLNIRGIIHIGAHHGTELVTYEKLKASKVMFIEANPEVYKELSKQKSNHCSVEFINCAISNIDGNCPFYVTSNDQSSSLLKLKIHQEIYPDIKPVKTILVQTKRLDSLFKENYMKIQDYNFLNMDIQGAELFALEGMGDSIRSIDYINCEVNREELYEGCALEKDINDFLKKAGFKKVEECFKYHKSWGDNFYIRTDSLPSISQKATWFWDRFKNKKY